MDEPFGIGNGMRNANFKLLWTAVEEHYTKEIKAAFSEPLSADEEAELARVRGGG